MALALSALVTQPLPFAPTCVAVGAPARTAGADPCGSVAVGGADGCVRIFAVAGRARAPTDPRGAPAQHVHASASAREPDGGAMGSAGCASCKAERALARLLDEADRRPKSCTERARVALAPAAPVTCLASAPTGEQVQRGKHRLPWAGPPPTPLRAGRGGGVRGRRRRWARHRPAGRRSGARVRARRRGLRAGRARQQR
jgi:hypothetical protein